MNRLLELRSLRSAMFSAFVVIVAVAGVALLAVVSPAPRVETGQIVPGLSTWPSNWPDGEAARDAASSVDGVTFDRADLYVYDASSVERVDALWSAHAEGASFEAPGRANGVAAPPVVPSDAAMTPVVSLVTPSGTPGGAAFHHTTDAAVDSIMRTGLRPGSYATPTGGLRPLQAHIELALNPAGGARNSVIRVDLAGLRSAGYEIPQPTRVTGAFGMPGGGWEMRFPYEIPAEFLKVVG